MDKKKGLINVIVSISFKIVLLILALLVRRFLIQYLGNEVNGLNSLYLSIIGFLSVAELGVGSAITFCMYKPISEGDDKKVAALYNLFTKLYLIIGGVILIAGIAIVPLIPYLAKDYSSIDVNLYLTFILMLISVVISYLYSSKSSLITAHKNDYIVTTITSIGMIIQNVLQILVLILTKSFEMYLGCRIIATLIQWLLTEIVSRKKYKTIMYDKSKIDRDTQKYVVKNVKAMFMHKIGGLLVNTADSVIISAFIGVVILGKYSNYVIIMTSMTGVITLFFTPLTAIIGHLCVGDNVDEEKKYCNFFHVFNFIIGAIFFLGYYAVIDDIIVLCFGEGLELEQSVKIVITINYFVQYMRNTINIFRDASGTFYHDRWKPFVEGVLNVVLSIVFVYLMGVAGVILATIITNLCICHIVEPYVLYKHEFKCSPKRYYLRNYFFILLFIFTLLLFSMIDLKIDNNILSFLLNGVLAVCVALIPAFTAFMLSKDFRFYTFKILKKIKNKLLK